ncbi:hypothetical protein AP1H75_10270 [Apilactobacillus apinorum]
MKTLKHLFLGDVNMMNLNKNKKKFKLLKRTNKWSYANIISGVAYATVK